MELIDFSYIVHIVQIFVVVYIIYDVLLSFLTYSLINRRMQNHVNKSTKSRRKKYLLPLTLDCWHAILFFLLKLNYIPHLLSSLTYALQMYLFPCTHRAATSSQVVDLLLESCCVIYNQHEENDPETVFTFDIQGFYLAMFPGGGTNHIRIKFDALTRDVLFFQMNEVDITNIHEQVNLVVNVIGICLHTTIHVHNNEMYEQRNHLPGYEYDEIFRHGQNLNEAACVYPAPLNGTSVSWLTYCLVENSRLKIPSHKLSILMTLSAYSPTLKFLLKAREICFSLIFFHKIPIPSELFFICSILHSIDHYQVGKIVHKVNLYNEKMPNTGYWNLFYACFVRPLRFHFFQDNRLVTNQHKNPFYQELYHSLEKENEELAQAIYLSISS